MEKPVYRPSACAVWLSLVLWVLVLAGLLFAHAWPGLLLLWNR